MPTLTDMGRGWVREATNLPAVVAGRCVHTRIETASCRACVDACPQHAWVIDDEQLGIDAERCDGCKLCVAACPEGAVQAPVEPALRDTPGGGAALLACRPSGVTTDEGLVPCVHALGLASLLDLYLGGVRTLIICTADCDDCGRGSVTRLQERIERANGLLSARELPTIRIEQVSGDAWPQRLTRDLAPARGPDLNRRQFLRRATRGVLAGYRQSQGQDPALEQTPEPPGQMLPARSAGQPVPFAVAIDSGRCNACHACANLCPHAAISLQRDEPGVIRGYRLSADACTGCGICRDVCDQGAVTIHPWSVPPATTVELAQHRCRACGSLFELPAQHADSTLCRICTRHNHHTLLYQVLE